MNVFDIIGPVMVGPSSSHTAGACRIGLFVRMIMDEPIKSARIILSGSFAKTYKGHGTNKALVAGLLNIHPDDLRLPDSFEIAKKEGMDFTIECEDIELAHPNTVRIIVKREGDEDLDVVGESVGGGNIKIVNANGIKIDIDGKYGVYVIGHIDKVGMVSKITEILTKNNVNINGLNLYRLQKNGEAILIVQVDDDTMGEMVREELLKVDYVNFVHFAKAMRY